MPFSDSTPTPTPVVRNIKTVADKIRASDENDTPISGLNLRTIASAIRHRDSTSGQTVATALKVEEHEHEADEEIVTKD